MYCAIGAGAYVAWLGVARFWRLDPLAQYRESGPADRNAVAVVLDDVSVRQYDRGRLEVTAALDRVELSRDRQTVWLRGVRNGRYLAEEGDGFQFSGRTGIWNASTGVLEAQGGLRVMNARLDLTTERLTYGRNTTILNIDGPVKGRIDAGTVQAATAQFTLRTGSYKVGAGVWTGQVQPGDAPAGRERWTIKVKGGSREAGSDVEVWTNAEATDGQVTVFADRIERNVKTDVLVATGNVRYFGTDADLTCKKVTVYRRERRTVLEGDVSMLVKAKDSSKPEPAALEPLRPSLPPGLAETRPEAPTSASDEALDEEVRSPASRRKYPTAVLAQRIEYWYARGQRRAIITGSPQARQDLAGGRWRAVWAHSARYDGEKETLRLESKPGTKDVRVQTSLGDDLNADWFQVSTVEGQAAWQGAGLEGVLAPEEGEIPERSGGTEPPTPPGLRGPIGPSR